MRGLHTDKNKKHKVRQAAAKQRRMLEDEKDPDGADERAQERTIRRQAELELNKFREAWLWAKQQGSPEIREATARLCAAEAGSTGASSSGGAWRGHGWQAGSGASSAGSGWRRHSWDGDAA